MEQELQELRKKLEESLVAKQKVLKDKYDVFLEKKRGGGC